jgi:hypothetical protein
LVLLLNLVLCEEGAWTEGPRGPFLGRRTIDG